MCLFYSAIYSNISGGAIGDLVCFGASEYGLGLSNTTGSLLRVPVQGFYRHRPYQALQTLQNIPDHLWRHREKLEYIGHISCTPFKHLSSKESIFLTPHDQKTIGSHRIDMKKIHTSEKIYFGWSEMVLCEQNVRVYQ